MLEAHLVDARILVVDDAPANVELLLGILVPLVLIVGVGIVGLWAGLRVLDGAARLIGLLPKR